MAESKTEKKEMYSLLIRDCASPPRPILAFKLPPDGGITLTDKEGRDLEIPLPEDFEYDSSGFSTIGMVQAALIPFTELLVAYVFSLYDQVQALMETE